MKRTIVVGAVAVLAVAAAVLSSIPAWASGPSKFVSNGLGTNAQIVDNLSIPGDTVTAFVNFNQTSNTTYFLNYFIFDANGTINDFSSGSIPASRVNVSGGSLNAGKVVVTLNVNTCDFPELIANGQGPCGTIDLTWTELPASVAGSFAERSNIVTTFPNGEKMIQNGQLVGFSALVTGTALGYGNTGGPGSGFLQQGTNLSITITGP